MRSQGFLDNPSQYCFITCGDWDLKTELPQQLGLVASQLENNDFTLLNTHFINRSVNVKKSYQKQYNATGGKGMARMLKELGMDIEGRHHSGIDDCKNTLRIVERMLEDGWKPHLDLPRSDT